MTLKKIFYRSIIILSLIFAFGFIWLKITYAEVEDLPPLKNGDLVFQTIKSSQTGAIMVASNSPYTHVGIIKIKNGQPLVVEAVGPVREISMDKWIKQGIEGRITIKRFKDLSEKQAQMVLQSAQRYYGRPYDFYFYLDKQKIYCSELVYYAFKEAINLSLGKLERLDELNLNNPLAQNLIKRRWQKHPKCYKKDFDACYPELLKEKLVTPASIAEDSKLTTLYSNYGLLK